MDLASGSVHNLANKRARPIFSQYGLTLVQPSAALGNKVEALLKDSRKRTALLTAALTKPPFCWLPYKLNVFTHRLASGQLQLRTLFLRPEGVRLRDLRLYSVESWYLKSLMSRTFRYHEIEARPAEFASVSVTLPFYRSLSVYIVPRQY